MRSSLAAVFLVSALSPHRGRSLGRTVLTAVRACRLHRRLFFFIHSRLNLHLQIAEELLQILRTITPKGAGLLLIHLAIGHNSLTVLQRFNSILVFRALESCSCFTLQFEVTDRIVLIISFAVLEFLFPPASIQ